MLAKYKSILSTSKNALSKCKRILSKYENILSKYKITLSKYKRILSKYQSILSKYKNYFQSTKVYFQSAPVYFQSTNVHLQSTRVWVNFRVQWYTFEVQKTCGTLGTESPEPETFLIIRVSGTRFPEPNPSKLREQNLSPRNSSNTETFETSGSQPSEPGTRPEPGFPKLNPEPAPARPEHTEIYFVQRPLAFGCWGKIPLNKSKLFGFGQREGGLFPKTMRL